MPSPSRAATRSSRSAPTSSPGTVLAAYRRGLFPMYAGRTARVVVARSARHPPARRVPLQPLPAPRDRGLRHHGRPRFADVMRGCADPDRPHGWIDDSFVTAYTRLHEMGWAHSVEVWRDGELAGGLYGVRIGHFFAGESMFHRVTDASKVALLGDGRALEPRRRDALRRAVDDAPSALARRGRRRPRRVHAVASVGAHGTGADLPQSVVQQVAGRARDPRGTGRRRRCRPVPRRAARPRHARTHPRRDHRRARSRSSAPATRSSRPRVSPRPTCRRAPQVIDVLTEAPRSDGTPCRVRRRPGRDRAPVGEGARAPRLTRRRARRRDARQSAMSASASIFVGVTRTSSSDGTALRRPNCSA